MRFGVSSGSRLRVSIFVTSGQVGSGSGSLAGAGSGGSACDSSLVGSSLMAQMLEGEYDEPGEHLNAKRDAGCSEEPEEPREAAHEMGLVRVVVGLVP